MKFDLALSLTRPQGFCLDVSWSGDVDALALVGPSGSGKSTALGLLAGVEKHQGHLRLDGVEQAGTPLHRRRMGHVTQDALLFPHLTVMQNLHYSPWAHTLHGEGGVKEADVIDALHLEPLLDRRPRHLSGGERRRVALGRALMSVPRLLLLDEPFAGLDAQRRRDALSVLRHVRARFGTPLVLVSHVPEDIVGLAEHALRLEEGRLVANGAATSVLSAGETRVDNHMTGRVQPDGRVEVDGCDLVTAVPRGITGSVRLACFAHDILLATERPHGLSARNVVETQVTKLEEAGDAVLVHVARPAVAATLTPDAVSELSLAPGQRVFALMKATSISYLGPS
ncbi:MAG: ATP-binding cassette domain-containing protein [Planctomycetota bacterium]|jgi:molybdate transport system ATP-binding protein|nr:ATP-binding cassette domain-containing protein [Planctomycetota bacterium]